MTNKVMSNESAVARWHLLQQGFVFPSAVLLSAASIERLLTQSRFCEQVIRQQPECLQQIIKQETLEPASYRPLLEKELQGIDGEAQLRQCLARFRNRQMLAICWHDLILDCDVQTVLLALSELADVLSLIHI